MSEIEYAIVVPGGRARWRRRPFKRGVYVIACALARFDGVGSMEFEITNPARKFWTVRGAQRWLRGQL